MPCRPPRDFQLRAAAAAVNGRDVFVIESAGSGKTLVGWLAGLELCGPNVAADIEEAELAQGDDEAAAVALGDEGHGEDQVIEDAEWEPPVFEDAFPEDQSE